MDLSKNRFIVYLIEDAVQVWHFAHIARKHARQIRDPRNVFLVADHGNISLMELFRKRVDLVCKHHLKSKQEQDTVRDILEELEEGDTPVREPIAIAKPAAREELIRKMKMNENKPERGVALTRLMHQKILELEERVSVLERKLSSLNVPLPTDGIN